METIKKRKKIKQSKSAEAAVNDIVRLFCNQMADLFEKKDYDGFVLSLSVVTSLVIPRMKKETKKNK
jgi:hypothetical protein